MNTNEMLIFTMLCHKGGVGKTTLVKNVGAALAARGYRVLIVDADPQGSLTLSCGVKRRPSFYDLIERDALFGDVLIELPQDFYCPQVDGGMLYILPGNAETDNMNVQRHSGRLRNKLRMLQDDFDVVLIDTNPSPSKLHVGAYLATDYIIYPTMPEKLPVQGLIDSFEFTQGANDLRIDMGYHKIQVAGVVVNQFRTNTAQHPHYMNELRENFGDLVWDPVGLRIAWSDATAHNMPVYAYEPNGKAAMELYEIVDNVEGIITNG